MSKKIVFPLAENKSFFILVPPVHVKATWYQEPSEDLNKFDEVFFMYETEMGCFFLANDEELHIILDTLITVLQKCLYNPNDLRLEEPAQCGRLGFYYNETTIKDDQGYDFSRYWLFSTKEVQTWIYALNKKMYIEISPSWRWLYNKPATSGPRYSSYEEFIKNYKRIALEEISHKTAQQWLKQCEMLLKEIE
jgi:hypothetical protein